LIFHIFGLTEIGFRESASKNGGLLIKKGKEGERGIIQERQQKGECWSLAAGNKNIITTTAY
jgi:hypothetical protein